MDVVVPISMRKPGLVAPLDKVTVVVGILSVRVLVILAPPFRLVIV